MKIKCIANTGDFLLKKSIDAIGTRVPKFDITIGMIYTVYSIRILEESVSYLLSKEAKERPYWYHAELFEIIDPLIPFFWCFNFEKYKNYKDKDTYWAAWGYKEMALDLQHHDDLIEREKQALDIFFKRKQEIDDYQALREFACKKL